eukprot:c7598_g1_i1.p1 GENE.c7598_g1_i1~~c7598_g1_i1.p1  ORF type:complete len:391 (-),score=14.69 c7598_g1_i1:37-1113(-)
MSMQPIHIDRNVLVDHHMSLSLAALSKHREEAWALQRTTPSLTKTHSGTGNIDSFLRHTCPSIPSLPDLCATTRGGPRNYHIPVRFSQLWEFFDRPFGHKVPITIEGSNEICYFVPHLSALQLFLKPQPAPDPFEYDSFHYHVDRTSKHFSSHPLDVSPLVDFVEVEPPGSRVPFFEKIEALAENQPLILTGTTDDIDLDRSWFAIAWSPILCHRTTASMLTGSFLTYHTFTFETHPFVHLLPPEIASSSRSLSPPLSLDNLSARSSVSSVTCSSSEEGDGDVSDGSQLYLHTLGIVPFKIVYSTWFTNHTHSLPQIVRFFVDPALEFVASRGLHHVDLIHVQRMFPISDPLYSLICC